MRINFNAGSRKPKSLFAQVLTVVAGIAALVVASMFTLVFLTVIAVAGLLFWLYFWWKTRALRAQIRQQLDAQARAQASSAHADEPPPASGDVIEGEAVRVVERKQLPE